MRSDYFDQRFSVQTIIGREKNMKFFFVYFINYSNTEHDHKHDNVTVTTIICSFGLILSLLIMSCCLFVSISLSLFLFFTLTHKQNVKQSTTKNIYTKTYHFVPFDIGQFQSQNDIYIMTYGNLNNAFMCEFDWSILKRPTRKSKTKSKSNAKITSSDSKQLINLDIFWKKEKLFIQRKMCNNNIHSYIHYDDAVEWMENKMSYVSCRWKKN